MSKCPASLSSSDSSSSCLTCIACYRACRTSNSTCTHTQHCPRCWTSCSSRHTSTHQQQQHQQQPRQAPSSPSLPKSCCIDWLLTVIFAQRETDRLWLQNAEPCRPMALQAYRWEVAALCLLSSSAATQWVVRLQVLGLLFVVMVMSHCHDCV